MLEKQKNQERMIMLFFAVTIFFVGVYVVLDRCVVDVIYLVMLCCYFFRFLFLKNRR